MKVLVQTIMNGPLTVYDSKAPESPSGSAVKDLALRFFRPVVAVTNDAGDVLYQTGEFYESWVPAIGGALALVGLYLLARRLL